MGNPKKEFHQQRWKCNTETDVVILKEIQTENGITEDVVLVVGMTLSEMPDMHQGTW